MSSETFFSINKAAEISNKSIPTIRKYLKLGKFPNATSKPQAKDPTRSNWKIPLSDLQAAGILDTVTGTNKKPDNSEQLQKLKEINARLEAENIQLSNRVEDLQEFLKDSREYLKTFQLQLETKQAQETRRKWWNRNSTPPPGA